ncbi:MAG: carboxypeptidase-like regulatory domain-containing protein [Ilumatobacteraceae bacterium]
MRTELRPLDVPVTPGDVTVIEIEVANTADVIDGVTARVEGIDPTWVQFPTPVLSLFPESTGVLEIHVRFPPTTVVGDYLVVINVESTIDPTRRSTHDLWLRVDPVVAATMRLRPSIVTKGTRAVFSAIVANQGNVVTDFTMTAVDETRVLDCSAEPLTLTVGPGTEGVAEIRVSGRRPWFGQPVARTVVIGAESGLVALREVATFNQRPRIPRGMLTLAILAGIVALWASVFLFGVGLLRQGNDPAKAVAANFNSGGVQDVPLSAVAGSALGKVTAQSTGEGLALITVEAYRVRADGSSELSGSAGTAEDGTFTLASLLPGRYKLRFTAEGYDELWYPAAAGEAEAGEIELEPTGEVDGLDVTLVGMPGAVIGTIELPDSATPGQLITVSITELPARAPEEGQPAPPPPVAMVQETTGPVNFEGLVTPATYRIRVEAEGFEPQEFDQTLTGGDAAVLNTVRLGAAAGSISGTVRSSDGAPLGNVQIVITSGDIEKEATTPTAGNVGTFLVDGLDTPRTYVLTFTSEGFSSQTIALDLGAGEARTGVDATLTGGTGTVSGTATDTAGLPLGGVEVTVARGDFAAQTSTLTTAGAGAGVGSYSVGDLPTPGTFAVTFTLPGYVSETRLVGFLVPGLQPNISVTMHRADASIVGTVTGSGRPLVGAAVELSDGETSRTTATASTPAGGYTFTGIAPGSYTLTVEAAGFPRRIVLVQVVEGEALTRDVALAAGP